VDVQIWYQAHEVSSEPSVDGGVARKLLVCISDTIRMRNKGQISAWCWIVSPGGQLAPFQVSCSGTNIRARCAHKANLGRYLFRIVTQSSIRPYGTPQKRVWTSSFPFFPQLGVSTDNISANYPLYAILQYTHGHRWTCGPMAEDCTATMFPMHVTSS
jgi:hypothetical protein